MRLAPQFFTLEHKTGMILEIPKQTVSNNSIIGGLVLLFSLGP